MPRHRPVCRGERSARSAARFAGRISSTTARRALSAISAPGPARRWWRGFKEADLLLAVGARIGEITSQSYSLMGIPDPGKVLIHVHAAAEELGRVFRPTLAIQSGMPEFAAAAAALGPGGGAALVAAGATQRDRNTRRGCRRGRPAARSISARSWSGCATGCPDDAIVTSDAGNFSGWPNRFLQYRRPGRQLGPTSGAMGYGVPAAVAAKLVHPDRLVVGFCGDGGFMMTGQELATSMLEGVGPIILVFNNAMYGTIRMHQERRFPGRVVGTALAKPRFSRPRPRLRRVRRLGRAHRGVRPGLRGGGRRQSRRHHRAQDGSGDDHDAHDPIRNPPASRGTGIRGGGGVMAVEIAKQHWSAERYAETAHFVPALGAPGARIACPEGRGADPRSRLRRRRAHAKRSPPRAPASSRSTPAPT